MTVIVSLPALVGGVYASLEAHAISLLVIDILAYAILVTAAVIVRRFYRTAAVLVVFTILAMGLSFLFLIGTEGATSIWLVAAVLLASLLLGRRTTIAVYSIAVLAVAVATALLAAGRLPWSIPLYAWLSVASSILAVGTFLVVAIHYMLNRLAVGIIREQMLTREVHHRVRNNLQLVESLLSIEIGAAGSAETREVATLMIDRIAAIGHSFAHLRTDTDTLSVNTAALLDALAVDQQQRGRPPITLTVESVPETLPLDDGIPLAIVIAELLSLLAEKNATIQLRTTTAGSLIQVDMYRRINGDAASAGIETDDDHAVAIPSIQREIMEALTTQFNGTLDLDGADPTTFHATITVPVSAAA